MSQRDRRRLSLFALLCAGCLLATVLFGLVVERRLRSSLKTSLEITPKSGRSDLKSPTEPAEAPVVANQPPPAPLSQEPKRSDVKKRLNAVPKDVPTERALKEEQRRGLLYFRANAAGATFGKLAVASLASVDSVHYSSELSCDRVHFRHGKGICLTREAHQEVRASLRDALRSFFMAFTGYSAVMFDEQLRPAWRLNLNGIPSRARVSPSGRLAAITVFLSGHSYASLSFSTQTTIVDVGSGKVLTDLESFSVTRNGEVFQSPDFNFWGVTFARDENRFYATLWSKGKSYLVECDLAKRTANVIYEGVECPSLSPDNMRIAFKKRIVATGAPVVFHLFLLDLRTLTERPLGQTRSVDDQVEWLDNDHVLYALADSQTGRCTSAVVASFDCNLNEYGSGASTDIWALTANVGSLPRLFLKGGFSPAVVLGTN